MWHPDRLGQNISIPFSDDLFTVKKKNKKKTSNKQRKWSKTINMPRDAVERLSCMFIDTTTVTTLPGCDRGNYHGWPEIPLDQKFSPDYKKPCSKTYLTQPLRFPFPREGTS